MEMVPFEISTISPQCSNIEREDDLGHECITKGADVGRLVDLRGHISFEEEYELLWSHSGYLRMMIPPP